MRHNFLGLPYGFGISIDDIPHFFTVRVFDLLASRRVAGQLEIENKRGGYTVLTDELILQGHKRTTLVLADV